MIHSDRRLSGASTGSSEPGNDGNEGVHCVLQSNGIIGDSLLDCLMSYTGHSLVEGFLPLCKDSVGVFQRHN